MDTFPNSHHVAFNKTIFYDEILLGEWQLDKTIHFMDNTNLPISVLVTILYIAMITYGQKLMANRTPFNLRMALAVWNFALSVFSLVTVYKVLPNFLQSLNKGGMLGSICHNDHQWTDPVSGYWTWLFGMSKGIELLDTAFLVLRKRPVIFLHWYHHSLTYLGAQVFYSQLVPSTRWAVVFNGAVHTIMYFYFGLKALNVRIPSLFAKLLTLLQIIQFVFAITVAGHVVKLIKNNQLTTTTCPEGRLELLPLGFFLVFTILYLFCDYFVRAHIQGQSPTKRRAQRIQIGDETKDDIVKKEQ